MGEGRVADSWCCCGGRCCCVFVPSLFLGAAVATEALLLLLGAAAAGWCHCFRRYVHHLHQRPIDLHILLEIRNQPCSLPARSAPFALLSAPHRYARCTVRAPTRYLWERWTFKQGVVYNSNLNRF